MENLERELEQARSETRVVQTRLDETEKEGGELSAECDELARQLNTEKALVSETFAARMQNRFHKTAPTNDGCGRFGV